MRGSGKNLSEASSPTYFECSNSRIALIGVTSSFHDSYLAGLQNQEMPGRPGAPLRHEALYERDAKNYEDLKRIAADTGINNYHNQARKEGFLPKSQYLKFATFDFVEGTKNEVRATPMSVDMERTLMSVKEAKLQADIVLVSIHSHQFKGNGKHNTPDFIRIFAHKCIDAWADIIVCHGPHVMRSIEQYNKGHSGGLPSISRKQSILEKIIDMSKQYQTNIIIDKTMLGCVKW